MSPFAALIKMIPFLYGLSIVATLPLAASARLFGVRVTRLSLLLGPSFRVGTLGETMIRVGTLPGGYAELHGMIAGEPGWNAPGSFSALRPLARLLITLSGVAALLLFACLLLGVPSAALSFAHAFPQFLGLLSASERHRLLAGWAALPAAHAAASLAAKTAAFQLLPLASLPGGVALVDLLRWRRPQPLLAPSAFAAAAVVSILVTLLYGIYVLIDLVRDIGAR